jgi:hypothetical protein
MTIKFSGQAVDFYGNHQSNRVNALNGEESAKIAEGHWGNFQQRRHALWTAYIRRDACKSL